LLRIAILLTGLNQRKDDVTSYARRNSCGLTEISLQSDAQQPHGRSRCAKAVVRRPSAGFPTRAAAIKWLLTFALDQKAEGGAGGVMDLELLLNRRLRMYEGVRIHRNMLRKELSAVRNFKPDDEHIGALPKPLRDYIRRLQKRAQKAALDAKLAPKGMARCTSLKCVETMVGRNSECRKLRRDVDSLLKCLELVENFTPERAAELPYQLKRYIRTTGPGSPGTRLYHRLQAGS
jgi:hypothetical protein